MTDKEAGKEGPGEAEEETGPAKDKYDRKEESPPCNPVLMHPEEWDDPPECTVISEFHKVEGDTVVAEKEDPDLPEWLDHWKARRSQKVLSEYHQEGAPNLEDLPNEPTDIVPPEDEGEGPEDKISPDAGENDEPPPEDEPSAPEEKPSRPKEPAAAPPEERPIGPVRPAKLKMEPLDTDLPAFKPKKKPPKVVDKSGAQGRLERALNVQTIEFLAYTVIRALFPRKVRYSLKREGVVDMDIILYERDVILNTNKLVFEVPELSIWRIVYAYRGKPVVELGRGVKNNIKIYRLRLIRILFGLWWAKRFGRAKTGAKDARREDKELKEEEDTVESESAKGPRPHRKKRAATGPAKTHNEEEE